MRRKGEIIFKEKNWRIGGRIGGKDIQHKEIERGDFRPDEEGGC